MKTRERIAERMKAWRLQDGRSVQYVATEAGISSSSWYMVEHAKLDAQISTLEKVARVMGITAAELVT